MKTIGVLGLGSIGTRHAKNIADLGHKVLTYDPVVAPGEIQDVLRQSDAIVIASSTESHGPLLEHCVVHGKPMLVEKPIAHANPERVKKILDDAGVKGLPIMVGNNLRFHSCVQKAKEWIDGNKIGTPRWGNFVVAQYSDKHPYLRDGVTLNWLAHEIDLALHLLGSGETITAAITQEDDIADICLRHYPGARSSIHGDYITKPDVRWSIVVGDDGHMLIDLKHRTVACLLADGTHDSFMGKDTWDSNYVDEMKAFIDLIDGKSGLGATGEDGLAALECIVKAREIAGLA